MRLLLAEDERSLARALTVLLRKNNYEVDAGLRRGGGDGLSGVRQL